jgi:glucose-1-phosphate adenylyltransferase
MDVLALILAGGQGNRLDLLSHRRSKPAMPFAGKFRIIDFSLSNLMHSHIYDVGILTQYQPLSLNEHIGSGKPWDLDRSDSHVSLLQPHKNWYGGTADAVYQNLEFMERKNPKHVLILSGDHIYKMDYRKMLDSHIASNADCTIACQSVPFEEVSRFGILETDKDGKVTYFKEKPKTSTSNLASMGIYIFKYEVLKDVLSLPSLYKEDLDFGKDVIPYLLSNKNHRLYTYLFKGYWVDVGTLDSYLYTNLELTKTNAKLDLYDPSWKIHTKSEDLPPARIGVNAKVCQSLISNGAIIEGTVINSVISPGVFIGKNSIVRDSVIMNDTIISHNVTIDKCIIDKKVVVGSNVKIGIGDDLTPNKAKPNVLSCGINVVERNAYIPDDTIIERNVRVSANGKFPENKHLTSGESI